MDDSMEVYISAEDAVTEAVILRLFSYVSPRLVGFKKIPARGGEVRTKISEMNKLASLAKPVVLLTDLDNETCPPLFKSKLLKSETQCQSFLLNIAVDEAEAWLMADREGFARYFKIPVEDMPVPTMQKLGGRKPVTEMNFSCKSSYYLTHELIKKSKDSEKRVQILAKGRVCKGPEYNSGMLPFIKEYWNIDTARQNSDSLGRMIGRLQRLTESKA